MHPRSFPLERAYRKTYSYGLIDLSSSAATSPVLGDLLGAEGVASLSQMPLGYESGGGSYELRAAVAELYDGISADNVLITAGAVEAIRAVAMALVTPDQRVIVQEPSYEAMRQAVTDMGGCVGVWRPHQGTTLADLGRPGSELAFLNSPAGPGGVIIKGVAGFKGRVVMDEVYRPIALTPARPASCIDHLPGAIAIGDLSKPLGLGGLRIGWIVSRDLEVIERCGDALDYLSGSVSALSAQVALVALRQFEDLLTPHLERARENLMTLTRFVELHRDWLDWTPPQAGYTACLRLRSGSPPRELFERLRSGGIFLLDGCVFGLPDCLRVGLGLNGETFAHALDALGETIRELISPSIGDDERPDVILYTKLPRQGLSKSRLSAGVGETRAVSLAAAFLNDTIESANAESDHLFVALSDKQGAAELWSGLPAAEVYVQRGADMGQRLSYAFEDAFARGAECPVLIGSDSPTLPGHLLSVAGEALKTHDVVIGPALDGGYYAIGLRQPQPALFHDIEWSSEYTLAQTLERARDAGLSVFFLPPWYDIDTAADLVRLRDDVRQESATAEVLRGMA